MKLKSDILLTHFDLQEFRGSRIIVFVKDGEDKPIPNAVVYIDGEHMGVYDTTNDDGKCTFRIDRNQKKLTVHTKVLVGGEPCITVREAFVPPLGDTAITIRISNLFRDEII